MPPEPQRMFVSSQASQQQATFPLAAVAPLAQTFPWLAPGGTPPSIGDEFAMFAAEALEWAELTLPTALEGWPDDDWPGQ
jgi:hypothetical protein